MRKIIISSITALILAISLSSIVLAYNSYERPTDPLNLLATPVSSTQIYLTWEKGYAEEYGSPDTAYTAIWAKEGSYPTGKDDENAELIYFGKNESFTHSGLKPGTTYFYHAWTFDTEVHYFTGGSFKSDTLIYTPTGNIAIQDLEVGDDIYTFNEDIWDGTLETAEIFQITIGSSITNTIVQVGANNYYVTNNHIFYEETGGAFYTEAEDLLVTSDLLKSDATTVNPTSITSSSTRFTSYNVRHLGEYPNFIVGTDRLVVGSAGCWSEDYDYDFATTLMGEAGIEGPEMPPWWFQVPECTAYMKLPIVSHAIEAVNEAYEIPLNTVCVIFTFGWILLAGILTFLLVHTAPLPILTEAILIAVTAVAGLVPMVFLLLSLILGGLSIFLWNKLS